MTEASSISYLIQKTFLGGKQEGWQENWKDVPASNRKQGDKILRGRTELIEGPVWGFAYCRPLVFGRITHKLSLNLVAIQFLKETWVANSWACFIPVRDIQNLLCKDEARKTHHRLPMVTKRVKGDWGLLNWVPVSCTLHQVPSNAGTLREVFFVVQQTLAESNAWMEGFNTSISRIFKFESFLATRQKHSLSTPFPSRPRLFLPSNLSFLSLP